jgi:methylmalonyl-CoA mutase
MADLPLASEFPSASREEWLALVKKAIKGESLNPLRSRSRDGFSIEPLYERAEKAIAIPSRAPGAPWQIAQRVDHPEPAAANSEALHDLENGANALSLVFAGSIGAYGYGLEGSASGIERALADVQLDAGISIELDLSPQTKDAGAHLAALAKKRGFAPDQTDIRFGFDPIGAMAAGGGSPLAWKELVTIFHSAVDAVARQGFRGPFAVADGRVVHNAGGSEAQELAFAIAVAVAYARAMETAGIAFQDSRRQLFFRLSADADQFLTIAKFRALRKLWARIEEASNLHQASIFITAETAWRMLTRRDPYVNMLRATVAVAAAGLGGANAVSVLPFTAALGLPDRFARRIARNTQLILLEESNLARVADPAVGAGSVEQLTSDLCMAAWNLFQEIERQGGIVEALVQGSFQKHVGKVRTERAKAIADGQEVIAGTTVFPNPNELPVAVLKAAPVAVSPLPNAIALDALRPARLSEPYE